MSLVLVLFNLHPEIDPADYEAWAQNNDLPLLRGLDSVRAADLYRRAAEKGNALAGLRYGLALSEGNGVKRDPVAAQRWLIQAQESGMPEAALAMGDMAARTPATRDKAANEKIVQSALSWYQTAANGGVPSAQSDTSSHVTGVETVGRSIARSE